MNFAGLDFRQRDTSHLMPTAEGEQSQCEQVVYKHLGWPDASSSVFSSMLAHFQSKKGLFSFNSNPSVIKYLASVTKYTALHSLSKAVVFYIPIQTIQHCKSSRISVTLCVTTTLPYCLCLFIEKCFNSVTTTEENVLRKGKESCHEDSDDAIMERFCSYWVLHNVGLMRHPGWVLHLERHTKHQY